MDETSLTGVQASERGLVATTQIKRKLGWTRPRRPSDRTDTKTSYLAAICDSAALQPLLPQVFLPRYSKAAEPPVWLRSAMASTGHPMEYWYGSKGWITPVVARRWVRRLRSVVTSFNDAAWIVLLMDCHGCHLQLKTVLYMRRLGIIIIVVPAKLTWLLQPLDVYAFGELKKLMRIEQSNAHIRAADGVADLGQWLQVNADAVRQVIVTRSWSDAFDKLGFGDNLQGLHGNLQRYITAASAEPALPTLGEFALLLRRAPHSEITQQLHRAIVGSVLTLLRLHPLAVPPGGARVELPVRPCAAERPRREPASDASWGTTVAQYLAGPGGSEGRAMPPDPAVVQVIHDMGAAE